MSDPAISNFSHTAQQTQQCVNELADDLNSRNGAPAGFQDQSVIPFGIGSRSKKWQICRGNCVLIRGIYFEDRAPPETP
ncbi:hypothetical protein [Allomesorhizobium alhagi]|jgi:hypothetical protein|uniref:Uncharacterized protein n=1 Tax=Mesorhizobium alhagi CCNWXJ12-2 TaxID=1107882 RepID=H0I2U2_9HYPH|nr:hypothetical protein [Mesorhizobium alhagi]EHK52716.1 hypothetical protein MAXJ12_33989 [Mesorhizobium alhagi CCNWXJ12-2]